MLSHINITIHKGEKVALVGENGAGKTTFVKLISGIVQPSGGKLKINGLDTDKAEPQSRYASAGSVSQETAKYQTSYILVIHQRNAMRMILRRRLRLPDSIALTALKY